MSDGVATRVIETLRDRGQSLVLAESCTCGMIAATLGRVPGASRVFCGSAVTYQIATKQAWLNVPESTITQFTAESRPTTNAMAERVLAQTPHATLAAAITGHFGPDAPTAVDGIVFATFVARPVVISEDRPMLGHRAELTERLRSTARSERQVEATDWLLGRLLDWVSSYDQPPPNFEQ